MNKIKEILRIGIPIMLGQACVIILAFADNIMIGWHSVNELAASSFVNNVMNFFILTELGFASGMTPIIGAFHGTGNVKGVGVSLRNGMMVNGIIGIIGLVLLSIIYVFIDRTGQAPELLPLIRPYFVIVGISTIFASGFNVLKQFTDGICKPEVSMLFLMAGNILNIFGNWVLIYGKLGCPEMGLVGASLSTLISRILMLLAFAIYIFKSKKFAIYATAVKEALFSRVKMRHIGNPDGPGILHVLVQRHNGRLDRCYCIGRASGRYNHFTAFLPSDAGPVIRHLHTREQLLRQAEFRRCQCLCEEGIPDDSVHISLPVPDAVFVS